MICRMSTSRKTGHLLIWLRAKKAIRSPNQEQCVHRLTLRNLSRPSRLQTWSDRSAPNKKHEPGVPEILDCFHHVTVNIFAFERTICQAQETLSPYLAPVLLRPAQASSSFQRIRIRSGHACLCVYKGNENNEMGYAITHLSVPIPRACGRQNLDD